MVTSVAAALAKIVVVLGLGVGAAAPLAAWLEGRQRVTGFASPGFAWRSWLAAPIFPLVPAIVAFAVIPFGGRYAFGDTTVNLIVADLDWGLITVFAIGAIAAHGAALTTWARRDAANAPFPFARASARAISFRVAAVLSVMGIFMVFQSLRLSDMAIAQDRSMWLFGALPLPRWGLFLQPVGFAMFLVCSAAEREASPAGPNSLVEFVEIAVTAALVTTLFLGGWALPFLPQESVIATVSAAFGTGFATGLCLVLHVSCFSAKVLAVVWLQIQIRSRLPQLPYERAMNLVWKVVLPLSFAQVVATGAVLLGFRDAG